MSDVSVVVRGSLIESVGKQPTPEGARVVDGRGKFLIPGLWDMHVHLAGPEESFRKLTANGVTGVRDMYSGVDAAAYQPWRQVPFAPRMSVAGMVDGPLFRGGPSAFAVATDEEARTAVKLLAASRVEFIKVYSSLSREAYLAVADEAHRLGVPFAGHVPESVSPAEAAQAGQLSQEHLINILASCSTREDELRAERQKLLTAPMPAGDRARLFGWPREPGLFDTYDEKKCQALFEKFVDYGVWHTPTLVVSQEYGKLNGPLPMLEGLADKERAPFAIHVRATLHRLQQLTGDMHRAGVKLLAGTDAGAATGVPMGISLHDELALLVEAGLSEMEALQTATRNPALYFGVLTLMGTVETGKAADVVLLDANPLDDIHNTRKIQGVMMRGTYFTREMLDQLEAPAPASAAR
ncbi:MAG: hypothetical protein RL328_2811 [Acidobacteriota bacterium]